MHRIGRIIELKGPHAIVSFTRHEACGDCKACSVDEGQEGIAEVINTINAPVGALVELEMQDKDVLKAAYIVYMQPLLALLAGIGLTYLLANTIVPMVNPEPVAIGVGALCMAGTYIGLRQWEKRATKAERYMAKAVKQLEE